VAVPPAGDPVLGVLALTRLIRESLEAEFPALWVRGEITGLKRAESGHYYFKLAEGKAAVLETVLYRTDATRLRFDPHDGQQVEAFGRISVYEPRGRYQLVVREMRPAGLGARLVALEELRRRLQEEGLFDAARKRPLPRFPRRIGLVTSPAGAAVRDLVKVLRARWPAIGIVIAPVRVQGAGAADEIAAAVAAFNRHAGVDVLVVGRGGGSLEDLWAFHEEVVVRAIAASRIPVISAVGHETDWTLADHAADVRAATPSNAAEIAVPERREVARRVAGLDERARRALLAALGARRRRLEALLARHGFRRHRDVLGAWQQRVDDAAARLGAVWSAGMRARRDRLRAATARYGLREWPRTLELLRARAAGVRGRLGEAIARALRDRTVRSQGLALRLRALSPRSVIERGFCIARRADGSLVRAAEALAVGERIALEFARGEADARVEEVHPRGRRPDVERGENGT
jgi:exodeoxyribonuclease VII large subunit